MNKDTLKHYLKITAQAIIEMESDLKRLDLLTLEVLAIKTHIQSLRKTLRLAIYSIIEMVQGEEWTNWDFEFSTDCPSVIPTPQLYQESNGFGNQKPLLEEIKDMIIELKIKGSVRERPNGLIEYRSGLLGSIYGKSKEEIEQKITKALKEVNSNKGKQSKKTKNAPLLSEFYAESYLPYKKANLAERSIDSLENWFKFIIASGMDKPLNRYTAAEIENFLYSIPQTRKRQLIRGVFNNILTYAKRLGRIKQNPCDNVDQIKHEKQVGRAMSFRDQSAFFNALYAPNSKATEAEQLYLTFVYLTGARCSEALSIKPADIDFESNTLHIGGTKTKGSNRTLPLFPLVKRLLQTMDLSGENVFNITKTAASKAIHKITKDYHLHELRHTFGTIAVCVQQLNAKTVSLYMGHSTIGMTLATYTHPEQLDKALFYDGSINEEDKVAKMKEEYNQILSQISAFLDKRTQIIPKN